MIDFEQIFRLRQSDLKEALNNTLQEMGYAPVVKKGFLYAPGKVPVLLVAHLDTVHTTPVEIICYSKDGRYMMSPQGIGGDDRAGVWMILQLLRRVNCHVLFCEDEERGGIGARAFTRSGIKVTVNYIIELDRKGNNDAVFYGCDNRAFQKFIQDFGFDVAVGSFSDISIIAPHLKTAAVNISTGYYNAHRTHEVVDTVAMADNEERLLKMIMTPTDHFKYGGTHKRSWRHSLFDNEPTDLTLSDTSHRFLMKLPEDAVLLVNGKEYPSSLPYMIDRAGCVYTYIEALDSAVESEVFACDRNGYEIPFDAFRARMTKVISFEDVAAQLSEGTAA